MPDKIYKCNDHSCTRCWLNRLRHGNRQTKAYLKSHPELIDEGYYNPIQEQKDHERQEYFNNFIDLTIEYNGKNDILKSNGEYKQWFKAKLPDMIKRQTGVKPAIYGCGLRFDGKNISMLGKNDNYNILII